jgi:O-antigen/teichoic acid export membrane protein
LNSADETAFRAISVLWFGSIFGAGFAFLTQVLLARELGPAVFGLFSATLGMVMLVTPLSSFGLGGFWLSVFGHEGWAATRWLRGSFHFVLASSSLVIAALLGWASLGPHDATTRSLLTLLTVYVFGQASMELVSARLQLEGRYAHLALWQLTPHLLRFFLIATLAYTTGELLTATNAAYSYAAVSVGTLLIAAYLVNRMYRGKFYLQGHGHQTFADTPQPALPTMRDVAAKTWPYGLTGVLYLVYFQSDIILLKYIAGDEAAGIYNVGFIITAAIYLLPSVVYQKFLMPKLHLWANHDRERFYKTFRTGSTAMLLIGLVAMVATWMIAPPAIRLLFGANYEQSVSVIMVLSLAIPVRFFASSAGATLSTQHHVVKKARIMAIGAAINVLLNFAIIPQFGVAGAAATTVATEMLIAFLTHRYAHRQIFSEPLQKK